MEVLSSLKTRAINYLASRESVLSDVIGLAAVPYSRSLRERISPEYQPRTRDKIALH